MEKIEEMAKIAQIKRNNEPHCTIGNDYIDGYVDGANNVLDIIEEYIGNNSSIEIEFIKDKIKELRI